MDLDFGRSEDRISKLSDTLLCYILSFLPTKYVVGTSILSTRWRYLWTTIPDLDFDDSELLHEYADLSDDRLEEVNLRFQHFVNRVLLLSDAPCFQKFHLKGFLEDVDHVDTWISSAIKRGVQDLKLCNWDEVHIRVPHILFTSKTLLVLTLTGVLLNVNRSVCLPSLKILNLDTVKYENGNTMQNLLSSCPVVEELYVQLWIGDTRRLLDISIPTLKRLTLFYHRESYYDEDGDQGFKLVVDIPQLDCLSLIDSVSEDFFLRNLNSLSKASIILGPTSIMANSSDGDGLRVYNLLSGIRNVKFLNVHFSFESDTNGYLLPTFHNLTELTFGGSWNLKLLADLLLCSPNLEVLTLEGNHLNDGATKSWNPPEQVPSCFSSRLKEIRINKLGGKGYELLMVEYFLQNASVLMKMTIDYYNPYDCFCGVLAAFRKESRTCQLNLSCLKHCSVEEPNMDGDCL